MGISRQILVFFTVLMLPASTILVSPIHAESENSEWSSLAGEALLNDPMALQILENIEISKQRIAELQNPQVQKTEQQRFVDAQRELAQAKLQEELDRMNKKYEDFTPNAAFAKYVAKQPEELHEFYWDLFNYMYNKVEIARELRDQVKESGGSSQDAQRVFIAYASISKVERIQVFNEMVQKHGVSHAISNMDDFDELPLETKNAYASYMAQQHSQPYSPPPVQQVSSESSDSIELDIVTNAFVLDGNTVKTSDGQEIVPQIPQSETVISFEGDSFVNEELTSMNEVSEFSLSAWIKPDYSKGSSELTIASKENSFVLSVNNNKLQDQIVKFSVFDGIKWTTVESYSAVPEKWSHVAATLEGSEIKLYIDGKMQGKAQVQGIPYLNSYGYLEPKSVESISSEQQILIGAKQTTTRGELKTMGYFSGELDEIIIDDELYNDEKIIELCENSRYFVA